MDKKGQTMSKRKQKRIRQFTQTPTVAQALAADKRRTGAVVMVTLATQPGGAGYKSGGRFWRRRKTETVTDVRIIQ